MENAGSGDWEACAELVEAWWQSDPLAEEYYSWSPFNSMNGSPIVNADPFGATIWPGLGNAIANFINNVNTWGHILPEVVITAAKPFFTFATAHSIYTTLNVANALFNPYSRFNAYTALAPTSAAYFSNCDWCGNSAQEELRSQAGAQVAIQQSLEQYKASSPFVGGGGNLGYGFASTFGTGLKVAPTVLIPELAYFKIASWTSRYLTSSANTTTKALAPFYPANNGFLGNTDVLAPY